MIIHISAAGNRSLEQADDFKAFKVVAESKSIDKPVLAKALEGIGSLTDDATHAWIDPDAFIALEGKGRGDQWMSSFNSMLEGAKKYGFVDSESGAVRAHVEFAQG